MFLITSPQLPLGSCACLCFFFPSWISQPSWHDFAGQRPKAVSTWWPSSGLFQFIWQFIDILLALRAAQLEVCSWPQNSPGLFCRAGWPSLSVPSLCWWLTPSQEQDFVFVHVEFHEISVRSLWMAAVPSSVLTVTQIHSQDNGAIYFLCRYLMGQAHRSCSSLLTSGLPSTAH